MTRACIQPASSSLRRSAIVALVATALFVVAIPTSQAHSESEAHALRPDVLSVSHAPDLVQSHTQWSGSLTVAAGSPIVAVAYQICRVGSACFAPPTAAARTGDTFRFNTSDYKANGQPVDFQPGWRLGVQWFLTMENGTQVAFPQGPDANDPACTGDAAAACQEAHYFAFDVAGMAPRASPGSATPMVALTVIGAAFIARRGGGRAA